LYDTRQVSYEKFFFFFFKRKKIRRGIFFCGHGNAQKKELSLGSKALPQLHLGQAGAYFQNCPLLGHYITQRGRAGQRGNEKRGKIGRPVVGSKLEGKKGKERKGRKEEWGKKEEEEGEWK
jgi:hypothetical protein